jgi:hypothetical protein
VFSVEILVLWPVYINELLIEPLHVQRAYFGNIFRDLFIVLFINCRFCYVFFVNFLSITTFLDSFLQFSCLFKILITTLFTCCSFVIDNVNVWYFHNVFRFGFVCNLFWVEFQCYGCCCCSEVSVYGYCCCSGYWILLSHWFNFHIQLTFLP